MSWLICCDHSLELPREGSSNEGPQHMFFLWKMNRNYFEIIIKYALLSRALNSMICSELPRLTNLHECIGLAESLVFVQYKRLIMTCLKCFQINLVP